MPKTHWQFTEKELVKMLRGEVVNSEDGKTTFCMEESPSKQVEIQVVLNGKEVAKSVSKYIGLGAGAFGVVVHD